MKAEVAGMTQYWERTNNWDLVPISGQPLSVEEDELELPFTAEVTFSPDENGEPYRQLLYAFPDDCIMSRSLIDALLGAGVDNLQTFPLVATYGESGAPVEGIYELVNVLGLVSCADLDASTTTPLADVYYFHDLVIDPHRAHDLLLFRLAESPMEIIVHERVARALEPHGFPGLQLVPLRSA